MKSDSMDHGDGTAATRRVVVLVVMPLGNRKHRGNDYQAIRLGIEAG